jgi:hypothetical protein
MRWLSMSAIFKPGDLGTTHAGAIQNHQQRMLEQAAAGIDQARHFLPAQDLGQLPAGLGKGKKLAELMAVERAHKEESQCRDVVFHRSRIQLPNLEQTDL